MSHFERMALAVITAAAVLTSCSSPDPSGWRDVFSWIGAVLSLLIGTALVLFFFARVLERERAKRAALFDAMFRKRLLEVRKWLAHDEPLAGLVDEVLDEGRVFNVDRARDRYQEARRRSTR